MLARHAKKTSRDSSFRRLVHYLLAPKDTKERVGRIRISHCSGADVETALGDVAVVQAGSSRTQDKNFHLLVSFQQGDEPSQNS